MIIIVMAVKSAELQQDEVLIADFLDLSLSRSLTIFFFRRLTLMVTRIVNIAMAVTTNNTIMQELTVGRAELIGFEPSRLSFGLVLLVPLISIISFWDCPSIAP